MSIVLKKISMSALEKVEKLPQKPPVIPVCRANCFMFVFPVPARMCDQNPTELLHQDMTKQEAKFTQTTVPPL